jgi:hypothetical protein
VNERDFPANRENNSEFANFRPLRRTSRSFKGSGFKVLRANSLPERNRETGATEHGIFGAEQGISGTGYVRRNSFGGPASANSVPFIFAKVLVPLCMGCAWVRSGGISASGAGGDR